MLNKENRKLFFYEVDPLFFKDGNDDGFGDFQGFFSKISYFKFLEADVVIFPDLFNQEQIILKPSDISIFDKYGKLEELKKIINWFDRNNINFAVEINIKNILDSTLLKKEFRDENQIIETLIKETNDDGKEINWSTKKNIESLKTIINFWTKLNVHNFVLVNFEKIYGDTNKLDSIVIEQLHVIYGIINRINSKSTIFLKSSIYEYDDIQSIFQNYLEKICDYYIDNSFSMVCTNENNPYDVFHEFNPKKLIKKIMNTNFHKYKTRYIVSFSSNLIGRVSSRWMNENSLYNESIKSLMMLIHLMPYSSINYSGDELGMLRTKINNIDEYFDFSYNERKRKLEESTRYNEQKFHASQKFLSPIHSQSIFLWDDSLNSGFSKMNNIIRKPSMFYKKINLKEQYYDQDSNLNFYKKIIEIVKSPIYQNFFELKAKFKVKKYIAKNIINYQLTNHKQKLNIVINPTNKFVKLKIKDNKHVLLSSYVNKDYTNKTFGLNPYEALILINKGIINQ